ncbi:hypothetical protein TcG_12435 [Trypanosoma cruzi]|nr:hypothetical protein TcG_12435 [Trypanosoma cruzi]
MAWPSFTSRNTPVPQLCLPLTQALKWRFGNPKFNTSEKQRTCSQRPHGSSTHLPTLLTTLQCDGEEYRRLSCTEDGQWKQFSQRRKCQGVKQKRRWEKSSQGTSPATPDVRRLIRATGIQRHGCCGACPRVHLTLGPMNASMSIPAEEMQLAVQTIPSLVNVPAAALLARRRSLSSLSPVRHPRMK